MRHGLDRSNSGGPKLGYHKMKKGIADIELQNNIIFKDEGHSKVEHVVIGMVELYCGMITSRYHFDMISEECLKS